MLIDFSVAVDTYKANLEELRARVSFKVDVRIASRPEWLRHVLWGRLCDAVLKDI
jgi:hypothetical protein